MNKFFVLTLLSLAAIPAHADWVELGVAAQCSADGLMFQIAPVVKTSDTSHDVQRPAGSHEFQIGKEQHYQCELGQVPVVLSLNVYGPQERGMGQGAGVVIISSLVVGTTAVITEPTNFNWQVTDEPVLTKVVLTNNTSGLTSTLCYSRGWDWEHPYSAEHCETKRIGR